MFTVLGLLLLLEPSLTFIYDNNRKNYYGLREERYIRNTFPRQSFGHAMPLRTRKYVYPTTPNIPFAEWLRAKKKKKPKKPKVVIPKYATKRPNKMNMEATYFPTIDTMQIGATKTDNGKYPWIARVIHSRKEDLPLICTAACIEERIFITAARCLHPPNLKLQHISVMYQNARMFPITFVLPSDPTKQWFDDIAFIIVDMSFKGTWQTAKLYNLEKLVRADETFLWFEKLGWLKGTAVGYVSYYENLSDQKLYELHVVIGMYLCNWIYGKGADIVKEDYFVPCYHPCDLEDHFQKDGKEHDCNKQFLAGEGHIVIEETTKEIIGVATWAGYADEQLEFYMPIGMSVVGSKSFREDLTCSRAIRNAPAGATDYNSLCK